MELSPQPVRVGASKEGKLKSRKKKNRDVQRKCWIKLRLGSNCIFSRPQTDDGPLNKSSTQYAGSKSTDETSKGQPVLPVSSSPATCRRESKLLAPNMFKELEVASQLHKFSFHELKSVTGNFRRESLLGEGGFGPVYKGWVNENGSASIWPGMGSSVAVKVLNHDGPQGHKEWLTEISCLGELVHPNLVKLIGYCIEGSQRLLVYEFMPRGSLENHLFRRSLPLAWAIRLKIALCAAKGLAFLHEGTERPVIYRDFKSSNILLDSDYTAKLSDFGLAKDGPVGDKTHVSTRVMGTHGYAAPEYVMTGHLNSKSDVYSFGVVLLELLTGRRAIDRSRPARAQNLVEWARPYLRQGRVFFGLLDPRLEGHFSLKGAEKAFKLAGWCINRDPKARPRMSEVVEVLKPLPDLKDTINPPPHSSSMRAQYRSPNWNIQNTNKKNTGLSSRNQKPARSLSMPSSSNSPKSRSEHPQGSTQPVVKQ